MVMVTHELIETFVVPFPANGTCNIKSPENGTNATFDFRQFPGLAHSTFVLDKPKSTEEDQQRAINNASIMTEDNSHIEKSPEKLGKPPPKAKKSAVAGGERWLQEAKRAPLAPVSGQIPNRSIRKGRRRIIVPHQQKHGPLASQRYPSSANASTTQPTPTAQNGFSLSKGISSSTSKLAHLQKKPTLASANLPKSQSLSREPSVGRLWGTLSAASSSSSLALDEKHQERAKNKSPISEY